MRKEKVVIALSGGVDSSVAALLLKKQGYELIGVFIKGFSDVKSLRGECAWKEELRFAKQIAFKLEIPLCVLDFEKEYKKEVVSKMIQYYKRGLTPNPDILCNQKIKFPLLWEFAKRIKADFIATGHYARIKKTNNYFEILMARDKKKDQSYFLAGLSSADLSHILFPIGDLTKEKVRQIAKKNNFPNFNKKSTRGVCFIGKIQIKKFLEQKIKNRKGRVVSFNGEVLGEHPGVFYYTIGQRVRPNIGITITKPKGKEQERWYIAKKDVKKNVLTIVPENHFLLRKKEIKLRNLHLINKDENPEGKKLFARIRNLGELHLGELKKINNRWFFFPKIAIKDVAEGQYIVFYEKEKVIGCGEII